MNTTKENALIAANNQGGISKSLSDHYKPNGLFSTSQNNTISATIRPTQTTEQGAGHA